MTEKNNLKNNRNNAQNGDVKQTLSVKFDKHGNFQRVSDGSILRMFDKTPTPRKNSDVICPHFALLAWASGCPYNCAWCYLHGTFRFVVFKRKDDRVPPKFKERKKIERHIKAFLREVKKPTVMNAGELCDGLMGETQNPPFSKFMMDLLKGTPHKVLFLSKGTRVLNFLRNKWQENAILAWSINAVPVASRYEKLAPTPIKRLVAARKVFEKGYEVRFRLDPMVPIPDWKEHYGNIISLMFTGIEPSVITLGTLRGLGSTIATSKDREWTKYLDESSNWGKKPNEDIRFKMFSFAISKIREHSETVHIGVCKDTVALHKRLINLGHDRKTMVCNCLRWG